LNVFLSRSVDVQCCTSLDLSSVVGVVIVFMYNKTIKNSILSHHIYAW